MTHIVVIGAGITGVTTAYELALLGFEVTVIDRHLYVAMETSFANGGQLSACNAEVWNQKSTVIKGLKWMAQKDAPLLLNPSFSVQKYSWLIAFLRHIKDYQANTLETVRLALLARERLFAIADQEGIDFDLEKRGILHFFHNQQDYAVASKVNQLLCQGGLHRYAVSAEEIKQIEPALQQNYYGGFYCPDDATGDIHKFSVGLANASLKYGVQYRMGWQVQHIAPDSQQINSQQISLTLQPSPEHVAATSQDLEYLHADAIVVCAGVESYHLAQQCGDRVQVYPVKGYSITIQLQDQQSIAAAPWVSLLDEGAKIVTSRLGQQRLRVAGTAEFNGYNRDIRADRIQPLIDWVNQHFRVSTEHVIPWAGLRPMMPNMLPVVGKGKQRGIFYNTGHGHLGWTLSAATAVMLAQTIAQHYPAHT
ncbi:D-amino acid dehydrogenase [Acinetobacter larvae]|uniref:D-amino acid dehydrogenase n=1 Tax=Acinetobacter larvae TaxID=1789224 RepID=A0A1B2LYS6_9GAMM|nr:D-amino acid dehydrogenase [Acinetobacter larvae]AOA58108.1 D-amino acid dehydrogenase [Acinetobacter larvae]